VWCGVDLGSRNVKVALLREDNKFSFYVFDTIRFYREWGRMKEGCLTVDLPGLLQAEGLKAENTVSTGYGRQTIKLKGARNIPEIRAHVSGAIYSTGLQDFTLLDLGGQDSKVALVRGGRMVDFQTNDKCAASTGRYLENMASVLDITMDELSKHYENPVDLTATCAIFGETELVGKIVEGYSVESLAAGVNYTIYKRVLPLLANLKSDKIVFTGGVARNQALLHIIGEKLGVEVVVPEKPAFMGAIGCSLTAKGG